MTTEECDWCGYEIDEHNQPMDCELCSESICEGCAEDSEHGFVCDMCMADIEHELEWMD